MWEEVVDLQKREALVDIKLLAATGVKTFLKALL